MDLVLSLFLALGPHWGRDLPEWRMSHQAKIYPERASGLRV